MDIRITRNIIAGPNMKPTCTVGVQAVDGKPVIRQTGPRGRILTDGSVVLFGSDAKGNEVALFFNPDEAREVGALFTLHAYAAAGVAPQLIEVKDVTPQLEVAQ